jgi:hypothetical protein
MLCVALRYHKLIDKITVNRNLPKLHKYQLSDADWVVLGDLVTVLEVLVPLLRPHPLYMSFRAYSGVSALTLKETLTHSVTIMPLIPAVRATRC